MAAAKSDEMTPPAVVKNAVSPHGIRTIQFSSPAQVCDV